MLDDPDIKDQFAIPYPLGTALKMPAVNEDPGRIPYNCHPIAQTNRLSIHAYGAVIDLATKFGDYWLWSKGKDGRIAWKDRLPLETVDIVEGAGFLLGRQGYPFDAFQFEYRPAKQGWPENYRLLPEQARLLSPRLRHCHYGSNPNRMYGFNFLYRSPDNSAIDWGGRPEKICSVTRVSKGTGGRKCPINRKSIILTGEISDAFIAPSSSAEKTDRFAVNRFKSSPLTTSTTCSTMPIVVMDCDASYRSSLDI
jgi:hypothetical protein